MRIKKEFRHGIFKAAVAGAFTVTGLMAPASGIAADAATFTTSQNGVRITCGLVKGRYVPGSGSRSKFVSTESALKALAGKTDKKSKAKAKKLKAYLKLAKKVCKSRRPASATPTPAATPVAGKPTATPVPSGSSAARGAAVFASKCGSCHSAGEFRGMSPAQLHVRGMPSLTDQEAADLSAYVNN